MRLADKIVQQPEIVVSTLRSRHLQLTGRFIIKPVTKLLQIAFSLSTTSLKKQLFFIDTSNIHIFYETGVKMIKDSTILVLGAGQIGRAACVEIIKREPRTLILHTLTPEEAEESLAWIEDNFHEMGTKVIPSSGDVLVVAPESGISELDYRFGTFSQEMCNASQLWKLIEKYHPDMIVDGINTATVVGYGHDPFTTSRKLKQIIDDQKLPDEETTFDMFRSSLMSEAIPPLVRFTQVLHRAMLEFSVKRYVKISTSGLGGMGFNIQYTHGDIGEPGCSPKLLGKVAASGILNQLIWTLSHTPGLDVKMIIPTALVGWEEITSDIPVTKNGTIHKIKLVDCEKPLELNNESAFADHRPVESDETLKMVAIDSGENGYYGIGDMTTITALGQMGCITKEEVGIAVAESLEGNSRYDLCTAMDSACLGPSFNAAFERYSILEKMRKLDQTLDANSVAIGNLGPKVTKHLWELEILRVLCHSLQNVVKCNASELAAEAEHLLLQTNPLLRKQIITLKMPVLLNSNRVLLGESWHIPGPGEFKNIADNFENWATEGWVDLRPQRIERWQKEIAKIFEFFRMYAKSPQVKLQRNWQLISLDNNFDVGEVLGMVYSLNGGDRKL